jgi:transcriptional regulator with XRE-family HTH domain
MEVDLNTSLAQAQPIGLHLRNWRQRRRRSQLDVALDAGISQRHLSFVESGRSAPSRDMLIHLADELDVPLRERNALLLAAGYAPIYKMRALDDPSLQAAKAAIDMLLDGHMPYPALAIDRHWTMIAANQGAISLLGALASPGLLEPPVNVLRVSLHAEGLAPHIANLGQWRQHLLTRLSDQIMLTGDGALAALKSELLEIPVSGTDDNALVVSPDVFVPLVLNTPTGRLSFFSTTTVFGTPNDVTLAEIAIEQFFPADQLTRDAL